MEIVIRMDVLRTWMKELGRRAAVVFDYLFAFGVAGAGIASFLYVCHCIFMWLAVA